MPGPEHIHALMTEIGPLLDLAEVYERADANTWTLAGQDGTVLFLEFVPDDDRLWLSTDVGRPRPEDRSRLFPLLLQYNAQWQQTGGMRMVLDGPDGAVVQAYDMPASGLDLPRLCTIVRNFRNVLDGWRAIVAGTEGGREPIPDTAISEMAVAGVIRG